MMLDGVKPERDTFHTLIVGTMKGSRLQDALYFRDQMKEMGLLPDVRSLTYLNSLQLTFYLRETISLMFLMFSRLTFTTS
jgi:pentatricopeptide repeat protein